MSPASYTFVCRVSESGVAVVVCIKGHAQQDAISIVWIWLLCHHIIIIRHDASRTRTVRCKVMVQTVEQTRYNVVVVVVKMGSWLSSWVSICVWWLASIYIGHRLDGASFSAAWLDVLAVVVDGVDSWDSQLPPWHGKRGYRPIA